MDYLQTFFHGVFSIVIGGAGVIGVFIFGFRFGYKHGHRLYEESSREVSGWVDDHDARKYYKAHVPGKEKSKEFPELK
jgi:hypothetical protein